MVRWPAVSRNGARAGFTMVIGAHLAPMACVRHRRPALQRVQCAPAAANIGGSWQLIGA